MLRLRISEDMDLRKIDTILFPLSEAFEVEFDMAEDVPVLKFVDRFLGLESSSPGGRRVSRKQDQWTKANFPLVPQKSHTGTVTKVGIF